MKTTFNWSKIDKSLLVKYVLLLLLDGFWAVCCALEIPLMIRNGEATVFKGIVFAAGVIMGLCCVVKEIRRIAGLFRDAR